MLVLARRARLEERSPGGMFFIDGALKSMRNHLDRHKSHLVRCLQLIMALVKTGFHVL